MQRYIKLAVFVSVVLSVLLLTRTAIADTYSDPALHYTLELPANLAVMNADEIQAINEYFRKRGLGQSIQYTTGFRPKGSTQAVIPTSCLKQGRKR